MDRNKNTFATLTLIMLLQLHFLSLPFAHFLLYAFLEGLVKFLTMLLGVMLTSLARWLKVHSEAIFRPSTWQVACAVIVNKLVGLVGSLGKSRRLAMMLLAMCWWLQLLITTQLIALTGNCLALLVALANLVGDWQ
jgi:hypothetical protein